MTGFVHGIRTLEVAAGGYGWPAAIPPYLPPAIITAHTMLVDEDVGYSIALVADRHVAFEKRSGSDAIMFSLDDDELTLPGQSWSQNKDRFVCPLRAIDAAGTITDFEHVVIVVPSPFGPSALDFSDPANSAFIR